MQTRGDDTTNDGDREITADDVFDAGSLRSAIIALLEHVDTLSAPAPGPVLTIVFPD